MVVSEIGEQWSPHTAPARQAAIVIINKLPGKLIPTTIGKRIPKVPQEVPVENARKIATKNTIAGSIPVRPAALPSKMPLTYSAAPSIPVRPDRVQAKDRIKIGLIIALKPSGNASIQFLKDRTLRLR